MNRKPLLLAAALSSLLACSRDVRLEDGSGGANVGGAGGAGKSASSNTATAVASTSASLDTSSGTLTGAGGAPDTASSTGDGTGGVGPVDPCKPGCGPVELCDGVHQGLDDDCNGLVDDGCPCAPGQAEACFRGDSTYLGAPGCFSGTQHCNADGSWGACVGGSHPIDGCYAEDPLACHAVSSLPYAPIALAEGAGNFDDDADPGSSHWSLACPPGEPCPQPDAFGQARYLGDGEYAVTYAKTVAGAPESCTYPLVVGAPGLRVELSWEFGTADLDLLMHEPGTTSSFSESNAHTCSYTNCKQSSFAPGAMPVGPAWFPMAPQPPGQPVDWLLDPDPSKNVCYGEPVDGEAWQNLGKGCHSPRLENDAITCDPAIIDPSAPLFCRPEVIAVDVPPTDGLWTRVAVSFTSSTVPTDVHPRLRFYCNGELTGDVGPTAFGNPEAPLVWAPSDAGRIWYAADVRLDAEACGGRCEVRPVYDGDPAARLPAYHTIFGGFGPPYPP